MTYDLEFDRRALKEWNKLGDTIRQQFKKKLAEVLENPRIEANRLRQLPDCYKLKLRSAGYRLIYQVIDREVVVFVIAIGKREREAAYQDAQDRIDATLRHD
ncbi:type II toxin-antitoxin system RelE/ParE family toxin [Pseudomonas sp. MYb118]|uniref:type II toxin-antitoxin system RelE/ParE family toxin n=1 Tax=Pseudomonas sp. MYb118 TaxID=1848720 RepID=UPI0034CEB914